MKPTGFRQHAQKNYLSVPVKIHSTVFPYSLAIL
jgi:hypothetical protein